MFAQDTKRISKRRARLQISDFLKPFSHSTLQLMDTFTQRPVQQMFVTSHVLVFFRAPVLLLGASDFILAGRDCEPPAEAFTDWDRQTD
jgi:hypothetical protein